MDAVVVDVEMELIPVQGNRNREGRKKINLQAPVPKDDDGGDDDKLKMVRWGRQTWK